MGTEDQMLAIKEEMIAIRRHLHEHPELGADQFIDHARYYDDRARRDLAHPGGSDLGNGDAGSGVGVAARERRRRTLV